MIVVKKYIVSTSVIISFRLASELFYCRVYGVLKMTALSLAFTEGQARALGVASMGRSHRPCITLSCSLGEYGLAGTDLLQGLCFKAVFSVPTMSPTLMCHHCTDAIDEQGLLTPLMKVLIHVDLVWDPLGRVCRGAMTLAPSYPPPATFQLPKAFAAQPRELSFSVY